MVCWLLVWWVLVCLVVWWGRIFVVGGLVCLVVGLMVRWCGVQFGQKHSYEFEVKLCRRGSGVVVAGFCGCRCV